MSTLICQADRCDEQGHARVHFRIDDSELVLCEAHKLAAWRLYGVTGTWVVRL